VKAAKVQTSRKVKIGKIAKKNKAAGITSAQAKALVTQVFLERGQPNVTATTKLKDIGYTQMINLYHLLASINQAIIDQYGKAYALSSTVLKKWTTVGDIITSVTQP
jgi:hypothetical protein